jgi:hypothetical protein
MDIDCFCRKTGYDRLSTRPKTLEMEKIRHEFEKKFCVACVCVCVSVLSLTFSVSGHLQNTRFLTLYTHTSVSTKPWNISLNNFPILLSVLSGSLRVIQNELSFKEMFGFGKRSHRGPKSGEYGISFLVRNSFVMMQYLLVPQNVWYLLKTALLYDKYSWT